ncbi:Hypothetical predicted protein, partial [Olea europaea subsp. europaea]
EYAIIIGLHAGSFSEGDQLSKALEKKKLKKKYFKSLNKISCAQLEKTFVRASTPWVYRYKLGLALIVEGVITAPDNNVSIDEDTLSLVNDLELCFSYPCAKVGYSHLLKGFRGTWAHKMSDAKMKNEKDVINTIHGFSIVMQGRTELRSCVLFVSIRRVTYIIWMDTYATIFLFSSKFLFSSGQIWAFEAMPELGEHFGEWVGERSPLLLCWTSTKQSQQRTYDAFFRDVQVMDIFHLPFNSFVFLGIVCNIFELPVLPYCGVHEGSTAGDGHDDESSAGVENDETFTSDDRQTSEGNGDDGSKANDNGDSGGDTSSETGGGDTEDDEDASGWQSSALPTPMVGPSTFGLSGRRGGPTVTMEDVEGMLLDQCILFEMRLRTVKLEIMQHVTEEFARLRDFISTLVPPSGGTSTSAAAPAMNEPHIWDDPHEDGQGSDVRSPHDDDRAEETEMQEWNAGESSNKWSPHDDDHADEGEMHEVNDGEGGDEWNTQDDDHAEEGDMREVN